MADDIRELNQMITNFMKDAWNADLLESAREYLNKPDDEGYRRAMVLPYATNAEGEAEWAVPALVRDIVREGLAGLESANRVRRGEVTPEQGAFDAALTTMGVGLVGGRGVPKGALTANVWQGGPHRYGPEGAAKSLDHIGKGEGAAAYGYGRYDAGAKDVATQYRKILSSDVFVEKDGRVFDPSKLENLNLKVGLRKHGGDISALMADPKTQRLIEQNGVPDVSSGRYTQTEQQQMFNRDMAVLSDLQSRGGLTKGDGYLYKHDLPDEDIARYMDWDKPLSEQPESVQKALKKLGVDLDIDAEKTGGELYTSQVYAANRAKLGGAISEKFLKGSEQDASEALRKAGIPGMKYLDQDSRISWARTAAHDNKIKVYDFNNPSNSQIFDTVSEADNFIRNSGTRNYVTWDQDVLNRMKLLERNEKDMTQAVMSAAKKTAKKSRGGSVVERSNNYEPKAI